MGWLTRRVFELSVALPLGLALWAPGCALQGEGERCDFFRAGDDDCDTGLVCVQGADLVDNSVDRCCPPEGTPPNDDRCIRSTGVGGTGGAGGTGGTGGSSGDASSEGEAGAAGGGGTAGAAGSGGTAGDASSEAEAGDDGADGDGAAGDASTD